MRKKGGLLNGPPFKRLNRCLGSYCGLSPRFALLRATRSDATILRCFFGVVFFLPPGLAAPFPVDFVADVPPGPAASRGPDRKPGLLP